MTKFSSLRAAALVSAACLSAASLAGSASAATLVNGSFETAGAPAGGFVQYGDGANIGGWIVFGDSVNAVLGINTTYTEAGVAFPAFDGQVHLDLTGAGNTGANGVYQDVATTIGQTYNLTFYLGNATGDGTGNSAVYTLPSSLNLDVTGAVTQGYTNANITVGSVNWTSYSQIFTAANAITRIQFTNTTPQGDNYAGLDLVSLAAVPEPATWAMFVLGFGVLGAALRRSRKTRATLIFA